MQLKRCGRSQTATPWGDFLMVGFEELATGQDHVAGVRRHFRTNPGTFSRSFGVSDRRCVVQPAL